MTLPSIGWIGTGVMGLSMCKHLLEAGFALKVFNRSPQKAESLKAKGAVVVSSARDAATDSDIVCLMVGYPSDVEDVVLNEQTGILAVMKPGSILCDFTTSKPSLAQRIFTEAQSRQIESMDAPVSGGDVGARNAALTIMCGGTQATFDRLTSVFKVVGKTWTLMGGAGSGQHTKCVNQTVIAGGMIGLCEGLVYAAKSGLNVESVLQAIGGGAAGSFSMQSYGPRMLKGDFEPGFYVKHFVKDLSIVAEEAKRMEMTLPGIDLALELYNKLCTEVEGGAEMGTQALIKVLESMNGVKIVKE
ncbi:putative 2-hydroxy-3-oxopropionate reductase [Blattamonas nauphoetae]|uniref:2-hydroxy-3-oxopropionate reductase n=1 Tax=Blattamonas nauphoetae TaxID=2049346 RepID=A0ABQ9XG92_9EUKA|nr:putative 2-hydroxy-3-oxopropionate reductase [Blattamonas nauphoetae]